MKSAMMNATFMALILTACGTQATSPTAQSDTQAINPEMCMQPLGGGVGTGGPITGSYGGHELSAVIAPSQQTATLTVDQDIRIDLSRLTNCTGVPNLYVDAPNLGMAQVVVAFTLEGGQAGIRVEKLNLNAAANVHIDGMLTAQRVPMVTGTIIEGPKDLVLYTLRTLNTDHTYTVAVPAADRGPVDALVRQGAEVEVSGHFGTQSTGGTTSETVLFESSVVEAASLPQAPS